MSHYSNLVEDLKKEYPKAMEEVDKYLPLPLIDKLEITVFVDSDHAQNKTTRQSITGIIMIIGRNHVFYYSKLHGAVENSTYSVEFMAMRHAVDEVVVLRYMLRCLGGNVDTASEVYRDNLGGIQNATIKESLLKKKQVVIIYHKVREEVSAGIIVQTKIALVDNFEDCFTKFLPIADHNWFINEIFCG